MWQSSQRIKIKIPPLDPTVIPLSLSPQSHSLSRVCAWAGGSAGGDKSRGLRRLPDVRPRPTMAMGPTAMRQTEQCRVVNEDGLFLAIAASRDVSPVRRAWPATGEHCARKRLGEPVTSGSQRRWRRAETERAAENGIRGDLGGRRTTDAPAARRRGGPRRRWRRREMRRHRCPPTQLGGTEIGVAFSAHRQQPPPPPPVACRLPLPPPQPAAGNALAPRPRAAPRHHPAAGATSPRSRTGRLAPAVRPGSSPAAHQLERERGVERRGEREGEKERKKAPTGGQQRAGTFILK